MFTDGTQLQDALSGATYTVSGGNVQVTLAARTGVVLLPSPVNLDLVPPIASISTTPGANGNGWINSLPVTVNLQRNRFGQRRGTAPLLDQQRPGNGSCGKLGLDAS